ncbi:XdhC family protein [Kiloniella laminariae]|uniref:XdhC family protein n=2 Tax=Kiloniella laminariae TaxID=454162 RepID=A0ABT4LJZ3_9PROT|nr:XdhC family protein [Kiloniella laminariae]MCZ4281424.1 XdhC family protein [Kiloniella laminariae]
MASLKTTPTISNDSVPDLLSTAALWQDQGRKVALATVVQTWGSSPRPPGSMMIINDEMAMLGSVSGGCIEGAVILEAQEIMIDGKARTLEFGVGDEQAWDVGLACGGTIRVYVERLEQP